MGPCDLTAYSEAENQGKALLACETQFESILSGYVQALGCQLCVHRSIESPQQTDEEVTAIISI